MCSTTNDTEAFYFFTNYSVNYQQNEFTCLAFVLQIKKESPIFNIRVKQLLGIHRSNTINITDTAGGRDKGKTPQKRSFSIAANYVL